MTRPIPQSRRARDSRRVQWWPIAAALVLLTLWALGCNFAIDLAERRL